MINFDSSTLQTMKKLLLIICVISSLLTSSSYDAKGTHLMGGSLTYEYLGLDTLTGLYDYRITITIYRYCEAGSSLLPTSINIGVYEDNPANPGGDKQLILDDNVGLLTIQSITPPNANDTCTFAPNVCVEEGVYQVVLSVPSNTSGYYFISDLCCRNNNIINLNNPGGTGQAYYAYAPAPTMVNSSPTFAVAPVPFICASDTASILNQAYDIDGDLLVYNLVVPYNGISNGGNPAPAPPPNYTWPIPLVTYAPTYSLANPFGAGGSAAIDNATGLATYFAPNQGFYVLAVEIEEWRNGVLIGITRRDLQIIVIPCPINPAPILSTGVQTSYIINEGSTLCFTNTFTDPNGDSIYINHTGDIFDPILTNPTATYIDGSGAGSATGNFCWTTDCSQGRPTPYQFSLIANDNGCPAKITNVVFTITVVNTLAPTAITGPDTLCLDAATGITYTVPNVVGSTHGWDVSNGVITGSSTGTSINVNFTAPGQAIISAVTVNPNGCVSDTTFKVVEILPEPIADAGPDVAICSGDVITIGNAALPGYNYSWSPTTGLSSATAANPTVTLVNTGSTPQSTTYVLTTTLDGCINSDTVTVTVNPGAVAIAGPDVAICSGNSVTLGGAPVAGANYTWTPSTGLSNAAIADPVLSLTNSSGVADTFIYVVQITNVYSCIAQDTVMVIVNPIPVAQAGPDISFCNGSSGTIGVLLQVEILIPGVLQRD